jgi:hypothetical protein
MDEGEVSEVEAGWRGREGREGLRRVNEFEAGWRGREGKDYK